MTAKRCIFLAGAPDAEKLSWDETALLTKLNPPIERFLGIANHTAPNTSLLAASAGTVPKWRSIALSKSDIEVSWPSQDQRRAAFTRAGEIDLADPDFLEHSIAFIEQLDSSQIISTEAANTTNSSEDPETTFVSFATGTSLADTTVDSTDGASLLHGPSEPEASKTFTAEITDLKRIPKIDYIQRIQPQTMTVNLLVGVIAVSSARTVQLRQSKREKELIEVTVGDETRAGFTITFWLDDGPRETVHALRPGQVTLLQSVALSSFRGNVNGHTLNRHFARNRTSVVVLSDGDGGELTQSVAAKFRRVSDWTSDFVGVVRHSSHHDPHAGRGTERESGLLPPDTQD